MNTGNTGNTENAKLFLKKLVYARYRKLIKDIVTKFQVSPENAKRLTELIPRIMQSIEEYA